MGGKEGAWGYFSQAIVAVVNSLLQKDWTHVQIEPQTDKDKVDIAWFYRDGKQELVQVKSSKNNFSLPDMFSWLKELINDVPAASEYRLILIGTCSDTTKRIVNKINENTATVEDWRDNSLLHGYMEKINIQFENNDHESLISKIVNYMGEFLSEKQKLTDFKVLRLMANVLGYQFMYFSTNGERVSREDFEKRLLKWVDFNFGEEKEEIKSDIKLEFYLASHVPFSTQMTAVKSDLQHSNYFEGKKKKALELVRKIRNIQIPHKDREEVDESFEGLERLMGISSKMYSELTGERKENFGKLSEKLLGESLDETFFYVGNLSEPRFKMQGMGGRTLYFERTGEKDEKEKFQLIIELEKELEELNELLAMFSYLDSFFFVPLTVRNIGTKHDENIRVKIVFPENVTVLDHAHFEEPDITIIKEFVGIRGILHQTFTHEKDSVLRGYSHRANNNWYPPRPTLSLEEEIKQMSAVFREYLERLFDFEIHHEEEGTILVFSFSELNPKNALAFPCFLLCQADQSFSLRYEITSRNLAEMSIGELEYQVMD